MVGKAFRTIWFDAKDNVVKIVDQTKLPHKFEVKKLMFLGSACIYPRNAPQPIKEEDLLSGLLEPTNEPYAIAKIAGITPAMFILSGRWLVCAW